MNCKTAFGYAFIHFSMEVLCFFFLYRVFGGSALWWSIAVIYDTVAFAGQVPVGAFCDRHPKFKPGTWGAALLIVGAAIGLTALRCMAGDTQKADPGSGGLAFAAVIAGFVILCIGNALLHISGALVTLRVSQGRMSETGIFVGGGAFGVVTGRLLGSSSAPVWIPFVLMVAALALIILIGRSVFSGTTSSDTEKHPAQGFSCLHDTAADRPVEMIILILAGVIAVRSYISNGIPMQWKKSVFETVMLYVAMGVGKMAGGVLADFFGARKIGVASCIVAVPLLLIGNNLMWVSLAGIMLFSMTMAIALGGIVSVLKDNPGVAFGITTLALFLGSLPIFFVPMPKDIIMNILLAALSLLSAAGLGICLKDHVYERK